MKLFYRTKILLNGFFPVEGYNIDGFVEKTIEYDETVININSPDFIFYSSGYLMKGLASYLEKEGSYYECLENKELFSIDVNDNLSKSEYTERILKEQFNEISYLQKKIRLITGLGITLPVFKTVIFDENNKQVSECSGIIWTISQLTIRDYNEDMKETLVNRLHYRIINKSLIALEKKNSRFNRAFDFYNKSFESDSIGIRFTLLFSALEALFNIEVDNITDEISLFASKILYLDSKKQKSAKWKLITYYDLRSRYIHGNDGYTITETQERNLREYVREVLLIYWNISLNYMITDPIEMKNLIISTEIKSLDINVQLFIKYLRTSPNKFSELYDKIKDNFLSKNFEILNNPTLNLK